MKKNLPFFENQFSRGFIILLLLLMVSSVGFAQGVAISPTAATPDASAGLDVNFTNKGFLISRVPLAATSNPTPLTIHVAGMIVYNSATIGDVTPGLYFNDGTQWVPFFIQAGKQPGDMQYWNGTAWILISAGLPGQRLKISSTGIPAWSN